MKILNLIIILSLVSISGTAQVSDAGKSKQNSITILPGYVQYKDLNLHPKVFRGLNLGFAWSHSVLKVNLSEFSAGLNLGFLNTRYEDFPSAASILFRGDYRYLLPVSDNGSLSFYSGPAAGLQYGTNAYFNWDESHFYYANYLGAGIGNRIRYKYGRYNLDFRLDIPIVSLISRPEPNRQYKIDDMSVKGILKNLASNPEFALPDKNLVVKTGLEFSFISAKNKTRSFGYSFRYHYMEAESGKPYQNVEECLYYKFIF